MESNSLVSPLLADRIVSPTLPLAAVLGTNDFASLSQQQIDEAAAQNPSLDRLVGNDADGTQVAIANVKLLGRAKTVGDYAGTERLADEAELAIRDIAESSQGPLEGGSLSQATISEETSRATGSEMRILMLVALGVIAALLLLFTRSILDMVVSLLGLVLTIVWMLGAQGWLGPNGLGLIGQPSPPSSAS